MMSGSKSAMVVCTLRHHRNQTWRRHVSAVNVRYNTRPELVLITLRQQERNAKRFANELEYEI